MEKVMIIGCGGAGKSTLARQLGEKTGLPVVHLDKLFWKPGWQPLSREAFDEVADAQMEKARWIIDGNYSRTMPRRMQACDTIIYLDFSRLACICGVLKRIITTYGVVRPDMGDGCPERFDWEFLRWVWDYNYKHRQENYRLISEAAHAKVYILKNRREVRKFLKSI